MVSTQINQCGSVHQLFDKQKSMTRGSRLNFFKKVMVKRQRGKFLNGQRDEYGRKLIKNKSQSREDAR